MITQEIDYEDLTEYFKTQENTTLHPQMIIYNYLKTQIKTPKQSSTTITNITEILKQLIPQEYETQYKQWQETHNIKIPLKPHQPLYLIQASTFKSPTLKIKTP